ncbi:MAG TPA: PEGA domain-containing protein [Kofleriaceae bacterium]|nr:PEGA domain-containing protein [Kofleriaceae bacterium]
MMRLIPLLLVLALATPAHAGSVGIVVTGDSEMQDGLELQLEGWLKSHGHKVGAGLPDDAKSSLLNCMVIDDEACARGIVDSRSKSDSVVFAEIRKPRTRASNATTLIVLWLVKGKEPVGMRKSCEDCNPDLLDSMLDEVLTTVVGASELARGRLELHSKPEGVTVMLDNQNVGITPLEREVAAGSHTIVLMSKGRKVGERTLKLQPEMTAEITMPVVIPPDEDRPSKVLPGVILAVGGIAIATGAVLYFTSEVDDGTKPMYRDSKPPAIGIAAGGVALAAIGTYLWFRTGTSDSTPVAAIDQHGGYIGWARAF